MTEGTSARSVKLVREASWADPGVWAMDATKPHKFIGFGDIHGPKPYEFIGFGLGFQERYPMLPNRASGPGRKPGFRARSRPDSSRIKPQSRPSGRPSAGRRADSQAFPMRVRPKSGPDALFPARKHYSCWAPAVFVMFLFGRSSRLCRSGICSGWPGDLLPGPWGSIPGPGRGSEGVR
jgi:hypothetical protein